jgi:hypothetical protein
MNEREQRLQQELDDKLAAMADRARARLKSTENFTNDAIQLPILDAISNDRGYIPHTDAGKQGIIDNDRIYAHNRPAVPFPLVEDDYEMFAPYNRTEKVYTLSEVIGIFLLGLGAGACAVILYIIMRLPNVATLAGLGN